MRSPVEVSFSSNCPTQIYFNKTHIAHFGSEFLPDRPETVNKDGAHKPFEQWEPGFDDLEAAIFHFEKLKRVDYIKWVNGH